jgi:hypothetical protein
MKFKEERPLSNVDTAVRRLLEIANGLEADHAGRLQIGTINSKFVSAGGTYEEYSAAVNMAIERGYVTGRGAVSGYLDCCCSVFGLAASRARFAIISSYSGVPRRGGASAGRPPIQYGMSAICSPAVRPPAQDDSARKATQRTADLIVVVPFAFRMTSLRPVPK